MAQRLFGEIHVAQIHEYKYTWLKDFLGKYMWLKYTNTNIHGSKTFWGNTCGSNTRIQIYMAQRLFGEIHVAQIHEYKYTWLKDFLGKYMWLKYTNTNTHGSKTFWGNTCGSNTRIQIHVAQRLFGEIHVAQIHE